MSYRRLNCVMIGWESASSHAIRDAVGNSFAMELTKWVREYPEETALKRTLRLGRPDLVVVDFADVMKALRVVEVAQECTPGVEILAMCEENVSTLSKLLRAGVRHYLTPAHTVEQIHETLSLLSEQISKNPPAVCIGGDVISFVPAKPGVGASTIAANTAVMTARGGSKRTLLADFDQNAGVQSFLFNLQPEHTLRDALKSVENLDSDMWTRLRSQVKDLDILPIDLEAGKNMDAVSVNRLLQFFRRLYDLTLVDLSGQLDPFATDVMLESKRVYLVCTQELACQHLLLRKVKHLRRCGLDKQMRLIINRFQPKHVLSPERISELVDVPVELTILNNYELANGAGENGSQVRLDSELGRSYEALAGIVSEKPIVTTKQKQSLLKYFSQPFLRTAAEKTA